MSSWCGTRVRWARSLSLLLDPACREQRRGSAEEVDVTPSELGRGSRHWEFDAEASSPGVGVYRFPAESDAEVLLPLQRDWADYAQRMADAILTIAAVEQRPPGEVLHDLSTPPGDVLRLLVQAPDALLGTLSLEEGVHLFQGGRDMLLAAACSAHQTQAYYYLGKKDSHRFID
jgi:hypothetical protein